jgi:hypothetical protein
MTLRVLFGRDQVAVAWSSRTASVEEWRTAAIAHRDDGLRRRRPAGRDARTCAATRDAWSRDRSAGSIGVRVRRSRAVTDLAYLSATVRRYGEPVRFRPGGVVDPDTGCSLAGPGRADVD